MRILLIALIGCMTLINCSSGSSKAKDDARAEIQSSVPETVADPVPSVPSSAAGGGVNTNVQHYYCANGCAGSGGDAQGTCPTCGNEYVHNQAYHNQPATTPPATPGTTITPPANTGAATNAAGVYHYVCADGHDGGAGAAGACAQCGKALVHNDAFHN